MGGKDDSQDIDLAWENRVLCSDESCIGTIGPDGCCRECGRRFEGELPTGIAEGHSGSEAAQASSDEVDAEEDTRDVDPDDEGGQDPDTDDEWARRTLCRDESCIGVIGENGCCKECGKPYAQG